MDSPFKDINSFTHCLVSTLTWNNLRVTLIGQIRPPFFGGEIGTPSRSSIPNISSVQGGPRHIVVITEPPPSDDRAARVGTREALFFFFFSPVK